MSILDDKLQTKLRYLKLQKIIENKYELGDNYKIRTEFCILKSKEEQEDEIIKMDLLCFTLGSCVILFDEQIHNLSVTEVQK